MHLLSHKQTEATFCDRKGTQQTAAPFVTCTVHNRQLLLLSRERYIARYKTDSFTFCHMQGRQQTAALCHMQGTQRATAPFVTCKVHNRQLHFCDVSGTQRAAAPFVTCKVHNRQLLHLLSHGRYTTYN
jgi:hypothetical protein